MNIKQKVEKILEKMVDRMGEGGMDTSYSGRFYNEAKETAKDKIDLLYRKQLEREIIKKIKTWEKTVECPLYVCCQDCYELSIDDVLDLLKKETK